MNGLIFGAQLEDLGLEFDPSLVSMRSSGGQDCHFPEKKWIRY